MNREGVDPAALQHLTNQKWIVSSSPPVPEQLAPPECSGGGGVEGIGGARGGTIPLKKFNQLLIYLIAYNSYPNRFSCCGSSRQSLLTFTRRSRNTLAEINSSMSLRAAMPSPLIDLPWCPRIMAFCDSRAT